jgi:hypothetical protein
MFREQENYGACVDLNSRRNDSDDVIYCQNRDRFIAESRKDRDLILWRRRLPQCLTAWLKRTDPQHLPHLRILVEIGDVREALGSELDQVDARHAAMRDLLITDIDMLAQTFAQIAQIRQVDIRLERIEDNACRLFHRDSVRLRLLTTYRGPSTEWIEPEFSEIALRNSGRFCLPIRRLEDYDVAIFKGTHSAHDRGVVHRSPPIEGSGETRLLLCINLRSKTSPAAWRQMS